jgi:hypothetical protein
MKSGMRLPMACSGELGRVFSGQGAAQYLSTLGDIPGMRVGGVDINPDLKPQDVGVQVEHGIGKEMKS